MFLTGLNEGLSSGAAVVRQRAEQFVVLQLLADVLAPADDAARADGGGAAQGAEGSP